MLVNDSTGTWPGVAHSCELSPPSPHVIAAEEYSSSSFSSASTCSRSALGTAFAGGKESQLEVLDGMYLGTSMEGARTPSVRIGVVVRKLDFEHL